MRRISRAEYVRAFLDSRRRFRVHEERHVTCGENAQRVSQILLSDGRKLVHAGRNHERLESSNPCFHEIVERAGVAGDDTTPEGDINVHASAAPQTRADVMAAMGN